ncbi:hypothetical protein QQZ08_005440 [Neonectria magnoliae]|uniref:Uncharacterized protein n=1 Tax=Neonectria magnoliae TaxID=2732573 RepID=A0ABR1I449_9HYPO
MKTPQRDEFLAGYLAGMDAGSAMVGASPPDEAILYSALPLAYLQSFDPTASPDSTHLLSLGGSGWLPASDAVSNSVGDQPSLERSPPQFAPSPLPARFGSPSVFSPSPGEGSNLLAFRPATSEKLPQDALDVFAFPSTEPNMLVPSWAPTGATSALQCASSNDQAADDKSPALDIIQYSRSSSRAPVHVVIIPSGSLVDLLTWTPVTSGSEDDSLEETRDPELHPPDCIPSLRCKKVQVQ